MRYDVFISCKSEDYNLGRQVYEFLTNYRGLDINVFMADKELRKQGNTDYGKIIDEALESSSHLIVVSSSADYLKEETSSYVYEEWHTFVEEIRSGRKKGNIMTIFTDGVNLKDVPIAIRNRQSFPFTEYSSIVNYLKNGELQSLQTQNRTPQLSDDIEIDLDYDDAIDFMEDGELQDAIHSLQASFENGNGKAIALLNKILFQNFGNIDWDDESWEFLKQQAIEGYSFAHLAFFYKFQQNKATHLEAVEHLKSALCDKQNGYAFLCEGIARERGIGMRPNLRSAMKRYEEAYKIGVSEAYSYVAEMYFNGNSGLEIEKTKAITILEEGCSKNDARSYYVLAKFYSSDLRQTGHFEKAIELYQKAASYKMYESWVALGKLYQDNIYINNRWNKAIECYFEAIKNGIKDGHAYIARLYWKQQRYEEAKNEAEKGAKNGSVLSMTVLGEIYEEGMPDTDKLIIVHEPNIPKAWHFYQLAFNSGGHITDAISLARLYVKNDYRPENVSWETIEGYLIEGSKVPLREAIELMVKALRDNGKEEDTLKYIKIGADSGFLDMMYEYGIRAISTNTEMALKFLSTASTKGHLPSIEKLLEYYKGKGLKTKYEELMDIAIKYNVDVPIEDFADNLYSNRPKDLWAYLKTLYTTHKNYAALYWMAYYFLHKLQVDEKESKWLYKTFVSQFRNISFLTSTSYDLFAKMLCLQNIEEEFESDIDTVPEKTKDYLRFWKKVHEISNIRDGEVLMKSIRLRNENNPYNLSNEWLQKYNFLSQRAFIKGIHIVVVGDIQEQVCYLRDILDFFDFNVSFSLDVNIGSQIETEDSTSKFIYLYIFKGKGDIPQTLVREHSFMSYINIEQELNDAINSIGKTKAIKEELIANRIGAFVYNLTYNSLLKTEIEDNRRKVILHCEDVDSNHDLLKIVLQKKYDILRARDGIEAVATCQDKHVDLVFMDIRMPNMDGMDATRIIKEMSPQIPIIALSSYSFEENVAEAKRAGMDDFISKPFKVETLFECTKRYLGESNKIKD